MSRFAISLASLMLMLVASQTHASCANGYINYGTSFAVGEYATCGYITSSDNSAYLVFDYDGSLCLRDTVDATQSSDTYFCSAAAAAEANAILALTVDARIQLKDSFTDNTVYWQSDNIALLPGRPTSNTVQTVKVNTQEQAQAVIYAGATAFWNSTAGIQYAVPRPAGYQALGMNEYVQSGNSYLLKQFDGRMCIYSGLYPQTFSQTSPMCI